MITSPSNNNDRASRPDKKAPGRNLLIRFPSSISQKCATRQSKKYPSALRNGIVVDSTNSNVLVNNNSNNNKNDANYCDIDNEIPPSLPIELIFGNILPYLGRDTWNNAALVSKQFYNAFMLRGTHVPWPITSIATAGLIKTMTFCDDNKLCITSSFGRIKVLDCKHGKIIGKSFRSIICEMAIAPKTLDMVVWQPNRPIELWTVMANGNENVYRLSELSDAIFNDNNELYKEMEAMSWSPNEDLIAAVTVSHEQSQLHLWDMTCYKNYKRFHHHNKQSKLQLTLGREARTNCLVFSPNGNILAIPMNATLHLYHIATRTFTICQSQTMIHSNGEDLHHLYITSLDFSPNHDKIIVAYNNGSIELWDIAAAAAAVSPLSSQEPSCIRRYTAVTSYISTVKFCPNRKQSSSSSLRFVTGDALGYIRVWDAQRSKYIFKIQSHNSVLSLCFAPNGGPLASGGDNDTIKLWEYPFTEMIQKEQRRQRNPIRQLFSFASR